MKAAVTLLCLAGIGALWTWALAWPKAPDPLPERLQGTFRLYRIDPPEGVPLTAEKVPPGQTHVYTFHADGHYEISIRVSGDYEMARREGVAKVDGRGILTLFQRSVNRRAERAPPQRFHVRKSQDQEGELLVLERVVGPGEGESYVMSFRPAP